jgi:hypothetical protein
MTTNGTAELRASACVNFAARPVVSFWQFSILRALLLSEREWWALGSSPECIQQSYSLAQGSGFLASTNMRQCGEDVLRILVTDGPPRR